MGVVKSNKTQQVH